MQGSTTTTLSFSLVKHAWLRLEFTAQGVKSVMKDSDLICHERLIESPKPFPVISWLSPEENKDLLSLVL